MSMQKHVGVQIQIENRVCRNVQRLNWHFTLFFVSRDTRFFYECTLAQMEIISQIVVSVILTAFYE